MQLNFRAVLFLLFIFSSSAYSQNKFKTPKVMEGVCPFECCTYGKWTAKNEIKVYQNPQDTSISPFTINKGGEFDAITGNVYITEPGLVIAKKSFTIFDISPEWEIKKNDTLFILNYEGEGFYNAFFQGLYSTIPDAYWIDRNGKKLKETELAKQTQKTVTEWWVKIVASNTKPGWILMKQAKVNGSDACD